jgi:hypothetical protein
VVASLRLLVTEGPTLPLLIVLRKTASAYAPWLAGGAQPLGLIAVLALVGAAYAWWRITGPRRGTMPHDDASAALVLDARS